MNNSAALLRNLIIYAICVPLAMIIAYWVVSAANTPTRSSLVVVGLVVLAMCMPLLLRWHHPLLIFCWHLPLTLFFLPGGPQVFLPMMALSLGISVLQRALNRNMRFIHVPQITLPLILLVIVVLFTAKMTGFGLHSMGSDVGGGKKYVTLLAGILAYFALTARRIPPQRVSLYIALFFLPGCVHVISDLLVRFPIPVLSFFFPPDTYAMDSSGLMNITRFAGIGLAGMAFYTFMLVRYGVRGIFLSGKLWRPAALLLAFVAIFFGGFRSAVAMAVMVFAIQFYLEKLHRTKLLPIFIFMGVFITAIFLPFSSKLPFPVQRAIAFLPVKIDPLARANAQGSLDWRLDMWQALLPEVPKHLLLGKGYAISPEDYEFMGQTAFQAINPAYQTMALAHDYHSGPLSVILPFGIWGVIAFLWFLIASIWALHRNYRYGDPALKIINTALFALYLTESISFFLIFGDLASGMFTFTGILGLSISLNGGICRKPAIIKATELAEIAIPAVIRPPRFQPAFPK